MPFHDFHVAVERAAGRSVWSHEFVTNRWGLLKEILGDQPAPSLEEIFDQIPKDKRIIMTTD